MQFESKEIQYHFEIANELRVAMQDQLAVEKQVVFHFTIHPVDYEDGVRIWKTTYLVDDLTGERYPLLFAEGVRLAPAWTLMPANQTQNFTLIFKGMPRRVQLFHLIEILPEEGGFYIDNIVRNTADVYYVDM